MKQSYSILQTSIVRANDGLILCEYTTEGSHIAPEHQGQFRKFMKNEKLHNENSPFAQIELGQLSIGYTVDQGVLFLCLVDSNYDIKLCKQYIEDIQRGFVDELKHTYGSSGVDYYSKIETIDAPYAFIKFDRYLKRKCKEFSDQRSQANIDRIKNDMTDIHTIMQDVFSKVMERGKVIDNMGQQASQLKEDLKRCSNRSRDLAWNMWMKKNAVYFILIVLVLLFILFKII